MTTWINEVVKQHSELESPKSFWYWSALCTISAVVKDNVFLDRGGAYKLYPNIYVMLHADSGLKKGAPVALAKDLVRRVNNTRIISGRASIQGILKELGTAYTVPGGKIPLTKSVAFYVASEFTSSLVNDPAALSILTDLYDRNWNEGEFKSLLKMESFTLKNPTLTMLVATNEAHFEDFIGNKDLKGGFIGRMFLIAESEVNRLNSLMKKMEVVPDREKLAEHLRVISKLEGEMAIEPSARDYYDTWYNNFYTVVKEQKVRDETGTIQRFGDSVLKVSMLLSLSDEPDLIIKEYHIKEAIEKCEKLLGNIRKTTHGKKGMSGNAQLKNLIIYELYTRDNHQVSRTVLMKKLWMHYKDATEFDEMMVGMREAGLLNISAVGQNVIYEMPENQVKELKRYFEGKNL